MRLSVESYLRAAVERAMKVQEVILRAMARKITWWQAAEIIGISDRQMRRWRERYEEHGYDGLMDRRRGVPSSKHVPLAQVGQVLGLYQDKCFDLNVRHFHDPVLADSPACSLQQRRNPAIAVTPVLAGQLDDGLGQYIFGFALCRSAGPAVQICPGLFANIAFARNSRTIHGFKER